MNLRLSNTEKVLLLILIAAFLIRVIGIDYGLPQQFVADEFLMVAVSLKMMDAGSLRPYFPEIFYHQPLSAYISVLGIGSYLAWQLLTGAFPDVAALKTYYAIHSSDLLIVTRFLSVAAGVGTVFLLYLIGRDLFSKRAGLLAAFFGAFEFLAVQLNHTGRVWGFLPFFVALAFWANVKLFQSDSTKNYVKAALASVAALITLLPGIFTFVQTVAIRFSRFSWKNKKLWLAIGIVCAGALAGLYLNPRGVGVLFLRFGIDIPAISQTVFNASSAPTAERVIKDTLAHRVFDAFPTILGYMPVYFILFLIGMRMIWRQDRQKFWLLASFPIAYYLFIGPFFSYGWVARTMLPLSIYFVVVSAFVIDTLLGREWFAMRRAMGALLVVAVSAPSIAMSAAFDWKILRDDTRTQAIEWIYENIPADSRIIVHSVTNDVINQNRAVLETIASVAPSQMNTRQRTLLAGGESLYPQPSYFAWDLRKMPVSILPEGFFKKNDFRYYYRVRWNSENEDDTDRAIESQFSSKKLLAEFKPFTGERAFDDNFASNIRNPARVLMTVERFGPIVEIYEVAFK